MVKDRNKFGFSLMEALVSMLILSVFFLSTSKVITRKYKKDKLVTPHGYIECYYSGTKLFLHNVSTTSTTRDPEEQTDGVCTIKPSKDAALFNIFLIDTEGNYQSVLENRIDGNAEGIITINPLNFAIADEGDGSGGNCNNLIQYLDATSDGSVILSLLQDNGCSLSNKAIYINW